MVSGESPVPIRLDVQPEAFNQTIGLLAELIATGEVTVVFGDEDETSLILNPGRVTWFLDPTTNARIPVVTIENLLTFAGEITTQGSRHAKKARQVFSAAYREREYFAGPYLFRDGALTRGFLALRLPELAERLQRGRIPLTNLGPRAGDFLAEYCDTLFLIQPGAAELTGE